MRVNDDGGDGFESRLSLGDMRPDQHQHGDHDQQGYNYYTCHAAPRNFRYVHLRHIYVYYIASGPVVKPASRFFAGPLLG